MLLCSEVSTTKPPQTYKSESSFNLDTSFRGAFMDGKGCLYKHHPLLGFKQHPNWKMLVHIDDIHTFTYKNSWFQVYLPTVDGAQIPKILLSTLCNLQWRGWTPSPTGWLKCIKPTELLTIGPWGDQIPCMNFFIKEISFIYDITHTLVYPSQKQHPKTRVSVMAGHSSSQTSPRKACCTLGTPNRCMSLSCSMFQPWVSCRCFRTPMAAFQHFRKLSLGGSSQLVRG